MFLVVWPQGMWDLSLLTRIEPTPPALEGEVLTTELPEEVPIEYLFVSYLIQLVDLVFFLPTTNTEIVGLFSKYSIRGLATINVNQKKKKREREIYISIQFGKGIFYRCNDILFTIELSKELVIKETIRRENQENSGVAWDEILHM